MATALLLILVAAVLGSSCRSVSRRSVGEEKGGVYPPPGGEAERMAILAEWMMAVQEGAPVERLTEILEKLAAADPDQEVYPLTLSRLLWEKGEAERALSVLEKARRRFPQSVAVLELMALVQQQLRRPIQARQTLDEALRLAPTEGRLYGLLAAVLQMDGQTNDSFQVLEQGLQRATNDTVLVGWVNELARNLASAGQTDLVIRCFRLIRDHQPEDPGAREQLAAVLTFSGRMEEALAEWQWLESRQPDVPAWAHRVGQVLEELGREEEAVEAYGRAMRKPGAELASWLSYAVLNTRRGRWEEAKRALEEAAERFPDRPAPSIVAGILACAARKWADAVAAFERAESVVDQNVAGVDGYGDSAEFRYWYGVACDRIGAFDRSEQQLRQAIHIRPDYHQAMNHLAYQWAVRGTNLSEALDLSQRSLELQPEEPAYWDTLGWIYFQMGDVTNALLWVGRAAERIQDPEVAEHMGDILSALGRDEEAIAWWERSLAADPENEAVRRKLKGQREFRSAPSPPAP